MSFIAPTIWTMLASCRSFAAASGAFANVYAKPARGKAVGPHADDRDVFVAQIEGRKRWKVSGDPPVPFRYSHEQFHKDGRAVPPRDLAAPCLDFVLERPVIASTCLGASCRRPTPTTSPSASRSPTRSVALLGPRRLAAVLILGVFGIAPQQPLGEDDNVVKFPLFLKDDNNLRRMRRG